MASEPTEERTVSVTVPEDLADWLDEEASNRDLDRETLLSQLLASYRTTTELDGNLDAETLVFDEESVTETVDDRLEEELADAIEAEISKALDEQLDQRVTESLRSQLDKGFIQSQVESILADRLNEATNAVQKQLGNRIDTVEDDFDAKITDVRERVIQVKQETDTKAPKDHSHEAFQQLDELTEQVETLQADISTLRDEYDETVPDAEDAIENHEAQLGEIEERLQTVAWVVSDLREAYETGGGLEAVERIKRAAAKADIERAKCENCGDGVNISLMTDPKCPHCDATVTNVEPASGWFSNPKLLVASQLESGERHE
jgi:myosin heavy subunit